VINDEIRERSARVNPDAHRFSVIIAVG
jgi:hypothetical protein